LDILAGPPPSTGEEILTWVASQKLALSFVPEVLFFAGALLVPGIIALYYSLSKTDRNKAAFGCGIIAVTIPIIFMSLIVYGRLVYPIYGLQVDSPAIAEFVISIYYGGLHAIGLLVGFATIVLSLAMKRGIFGRGTAYLGFATGVFDIIGGYPDTIGPILIMFSQLLFAAWFIALGSKLYGLRFVDKTAIMHE